MARQRSPPRSRASGVHIQQEANGLVQRAEAEVKHIAKEIDQSLHQTGHSNAGLLQLFIAACGIYGAFLTWSILQERLTTTPYGPLRERWTYSIFLNTVQSTFAAISGYAYLTYANWDKASKPPVFPSRAIFGPLTLVAVTTSLASPFGYASLKHIDYVTFLLAKSCKLLPVMFLHITIFRKKYPLWKYAVVAAVTAGVAVFTLHAPASSKKKALNVGGNRMWGMLLLSINLLFDGLTNSVQDYIFTNFQPYTAPQMMVAGNTMGTILQGLYLILAPYVAQTAFGTYVGMGSGTELSDALDFIKKYPSVGKDVLGFSACGAIGQVFIYYTLANFDSLKLVTITVTRKMFSMVLSVLIYGHHLTSRQFMGVGLVFTAIGAEAVLESKEKAEKKRLAAEKARAANGAIRDRKEV